MGFTLTLVPTELERRQLPATITDATGGHTACELCGFGPIVAAARTAQLIAHYRPSKVILLGIAGGLHPGATVGKAYAFTLVRCDGIGIGEGGKFVPSSKIGFAQWNQSDNDSAKPQLPEAFSIDDQLQLCQDTFDADSLAGELLTVCAASSSLGEAQSRRTRYPNAWAEDMEAFGVAAACGLHSVPLTAIRGISNVAGDRDKGNWQIATALHSASALHHALTLV
jgi:futalosine hydrolase